MSGCPGTAFTVPCAADVVVVGAGAAGIAAAISAARCGCRVLLLEKSVRLGGTVTRGLIHTLGGLYDSAGEPFPHTLLRELMGRLRRASSAVRRRRMGRTFVLACDPEAYESVVTSWTSGEPGIETWTSARVLDVERRDHEVAAVWVDRAGQRLWVACKAIIDATGTAEVTRCLSPQLVQSGPPSAAGGVVFTVGGLSPGAVQHPRNVGVLLAIREAVSDGKLPLACSKAWLDRGDAEDQAYVKLLVSVGDGSHRERAAALRCAHRARDAMMLFLRSRPAFRRARLERSGELSLREAGRVVGQYLLTEQDVREGRRFPDAVARSAWPIEHWDPESGVRLEYLPDGSFYEIPLRALAVRGVPNLWAAGKVLCAEPRAQASARVVGTCWAMGDGAGRAAAEYARVERSAAKVPDAEDPIRPRHEPRVLGANP